MLSPIDAREQRGRAIAQLEGQITRIDENTYKIKSQSGNGEYAVIQTELGWLCECPDALYRGGYPDYKGCKHSFAVVYSQKLREIVQSQTIIPSLDLATCPYCKSREIIRRGLRHNVNGDIQRYGCKNCQREFVRTFAFEGMKAPPNVITAALQLYFSGESLRNTQRFLALQGVKICHRTVYNWIQKYVELMQSYVEHIKPNVSDVWRTDELYLKIKGDKRYLFAVMDDETRYWIAEQVANHKGVSDIRPLFREAKRVSLIQPSKIISDGASNFAVAFTDEFATQDPRPLHVAEIRIDGQVHNNKMERMNGELRDREKVMRSLKRDDSPILRGLQIYHNFIRPHESLHGKTPADLAGIRVEGENKWLTLIQNAQARKDKSSNFENCE